MPGIIVHIRMTFPVCIGLRVVLGAFLYFVIVHCHWRSTTRMQDGHATARTLRRLGVTAPIIGVTGNALLEDQLAFKKAGADAVITKPCTAAALTAMLQLHGLHFRVLPSTNNVSQETGAELLSADYTTVLPAAHAVAALPPTASKEASACARGDTS